MYLSKLTKLTTKLLDKYDLYAPTQEEDRIVIKKIEKNDAVDYSGVIPENLFRNLFLPYEESLSEITYTAKSAKSKSTANDQSPVKSILSSIKRDTGQKLISRLEIAWGMHLLDLRALAMLDLVFKNDPYYTARRAEILVVGFKKSDRLDNFIKLADRILNHIQFDLFLVKVKDKFYWASGSIAGQEFIKKHHLKSFQHFVFRGYTPKLGLDPNIEIWRRKIKKSKNHPIWLELAKICLACGKCTANCPTCFCFNLEQETLENKTCLARRQTSCFYPEFAKVAGDMNFLSDLADRLYFWYYHKFVRIPETLGIEGCVMCGRCYKTCPVDIGVAQTLARLEG